MTDSISKYTVYQLRGLPPGVFGESYVVVACDDSSTGEYRAEHHILTQRPQESLRSSVSNIAGEIKGVKSLLGSTQSGKRNKRGQA